jgi:GcrA cell cycle regulator
VQLRLSEIRLDFYFGISEIKEGLIPLGRHQPLLDYAHGRAPLRFRRGVSFASYRHAFGGRLMQQTSWPREHSDALRQHLAAGLSFAEIADVLNAKFQTAYSRNAMIGRAKRMGLAGPARPDALPRTPQSTPPEPLPHGPRERRQPEFRPVAPRGSAAAEAVELRRAEIDPRHLTLHELGPDDCRYPYGGDAEGEAITFCGHPRRTGSYCLAHFRLSIGPGSAAERAAIKTALKILEAA